MATEINQPSLTTSLRALDRIAGVLTASQSRVIGATDWQSLVDAISISLGSPGVQRDVSLAPMRDFVDRQIVRNLWRVASGRDSTKMRDRLDYYDKSIGNLSTAISRINGFSGAVRDISQFFVALMQLRDIEIGDNTTAQDAVSEMKLAIFAEIRSRITNAAILLDPDGVGYARRRDGETMEAVAEEFYALRRFADALVQEGQDETWMKIAKPAVQYKIEAIGRIVALVANRVDMLTQLKQNLINARNQEFADAAAAAVDALPASLRKYVDAGFMAARGTKDLDRQTAEPPVMGA